MHFPALLITLLIVVGFVITAFCLWLSLKIFGLKSDKGSLAKIVGIETAFLGLVGWAGSTTHSGLAVLVGLLFLMGGLVLWALLLRHFAVSKYHPGRALASYLVSYVLASAISLIIAILSLAFFMQAYTIDGDSMAPALKANQKVLVYKFESRPNGNEIVVYTSNKGTQSLGRVRGTPGQSVSISGGHVVVNGNLQNVTSFALGDNQYYVTADNAAYNIPPRIIKSSDIIGTVGPKL